MSHMQPEVTERGLHWKVETDDGTWFVPGNVCAPPDWLAVGKPVDMDDDHLAGYFCHLLQAFIEPGFDHCYSVEVVRGYCGRYQAPGYLDATDWSFGTNRRQLLSELRDLYGEE